jgi:acylphosphatase
VSADGADPTHAAAPADGTDPDAAMRVEFTVVGVVQGVGYRYFAWREASDMALTGWVANEADGSVHGIAEGPRAAIDAFLERLAEGPPAALVRDLRVVRMPATGTLGPFGVRSGAHRGD